MTIWQDKDIFLTGHTGFKGSWLSLWLHSLGSRVHGYALDPPTEPSVFEVAGVASALASDVRADLADAARLSQAMSDAQPEAVFHLAAQPLVRASYSDPLGTFVTNVIGTANLLQAVRSVPSVKAVVIVTTDKVYENREWVHPYREGDRLGGHDPYSASKAAAEIVTASMRDSFFRDSPVRIATARAGNVIGGGDWAADRLVPDCLRAFAAGEPVRLRYPGAVRPWQHVLEPLGGYLALAEALLREPGRAAAGAWNFGPEAADNVTVGEVAERLAAAWGGTARVICNADADVPHEAGLLSLDISSARRHLAWHPRWALGEALGKTLAWHTAWLAGEAMHEVTLAQINDYQESARA
ncbi:CDP-glucose 4,6-dehydratase [Akkermansiaceae bacterium]|nr:CDP-glucose 4,6-dehydratase [Akkermansiaceae bacterium]